LRSQDQALQKVNQEADLVKDKLNGALRFSLSATKTLAFLVERYGVPEDFNSIARDIIESNKYIDAVELTDKGVITHVYPLKGNEVVIGYDILKDSLTNREALRALERRELFFAGPLNLKQGGKGVVGRLPIFRDSTFLGFSVVLIKLATLLNAAEIDSPDKNFLYQFSKINPATGKEEFFLDDSIPHEKRHVATMGVPDGEWKLYVMQKDKSPEVLNVLGFALLGLIFSITAGIFSGYLVRQPARLNELVKERTSQLAAEKNLSESMINSLPGIFYVFDKNGNYMRWNKNLETVTGYSAQEIGRMNSLEFFEPDEAKKVKARVQEIFETGSGLDVTAAFYSREGKKMDYYFYGRKAVFNGEDYLVGMAFDISDRLEAENKLRERTAEIQRLTGHLEKIQEEERTRIAREIHDELGQQLTCLKMDAAWVGKKISPEEKMLHQKLNSMLSVIDDTVKSVRRISSELRPGILDDLGLIPALEWQSQEFEKHAGIKSIFTSRINHFNPEWNVSTHVFRVYQEALTNVARHAQATQVETVIEQEDDHVVLRVKDNGNGIDMAEASIKNSLGLIGMRERAFLFQGQLSIEGEKQVGTTVTLRIPLVNVNSNAL
jgi:PAS domain S-box-containing protein